MAKNTYQSRAYSVNANLPSLYPEAKRMQRNPVDGADAGVFGQIWINESNNAIFILSNQKTRNWVDLSGGEAEFTDLVVNGTTFLDGNTTQAGNFELLQGGEAASFRVGSGSPNGSLTGSQGSLYLNTAGSGTTDRAFINTDGGTGWTSITTAS